MKYNYDRSFTFTFNDDAWEAFLVTEEEFKELDKEISEATGDDLEEDDAIAMVLTKKNCLFLTEGNIDIQTIGHELYHMYVHYFNLNSADLTVDQFEEVNAEFIGHHIDKFIKIRDELYRKYKELL